MALEDGVLPAVGVGLADSVDKIHGEPPLPWHGVTPALGVGLVRDQILVVHGESFGR